MSRTEVSWMRPNPDHDQHCRAYADWVARNIPPALGHRIESMSWTLIRALCDARELVTQHRRLSGSESTLQQ